MMTANLQPNDYRSELKPIWCPGCGDFGVLTAIYRALAAIGRAPHEIAFVSGIGCSGRIPGYTTAYGFNSVHGRALPIARGIKMANPELLVLVAGGDGDGFSIGGGHVPHAIRRNPDLTYIVMDNQIYGLTTGQTSPTSRKGMKTKSMPYGNVEEPINPIALALAAGATFVARGYSAEPKQLIDLIKQGLEHKGFAFIDVFSPCVTYNHDNTYAWFKTRVRKLEDDPSYDSTDWHAAMKRSLLWGDEIPIGKFFQRTDLPSLDQAEPVLNEGGPLAHRELRIAPHVMREFIAELM
jgi:2-oxoglutarate ferredoxin oxidoreductase subunit beta